MNKSNWTEEDHIEYAEMKRDEARDEWKEREREFEEMIDNDINAIKSIPTNEKYRIFQAVLLSYDERFKLDLEW